MEIDPNGFVVAIAVIAAAGFLLGWLLGRMVLVNRCRFLAIKWRRSHGDYPEAKADCAEELEQAIDG